MHSYLKKIGWVNFTKWWYPKPSTSFQSGYWSILCLLDIWTILWFWCMDVLSTGGLPMTYHLGVWVYVLHVSAFGRVYPSRREDTIESWAITPQLVLCLCSSLVPSAQQTFTRKNMFWDGYLKVPPNILTRMALFTSGGVAAKNIAGKFLTQINLGKVQTLMTQMILKKVSASALWTDHIDCFTYMAKGTGAFPYLKFSYFFDLRPFHKKKTFAKYCNLKKKYSYRNTI